MVNDAMPTHEGWRQEVGQIESRAAMPNRYADAQIKIGWLWL